MAGRGGGERGVRIGGEGGLDDLGGSYGFQENLGNGGEISRHQQRLKEDLRNLTANYKEEESLEYSLLQPLSYPSFGPLFTPLINCKFRDGNHNFH